MILVSGATGTVGGSVVRLLAERDIPVRAMTRNPDQARVPDGVAAVRADFADPGSLDAAVQGASALLLIAPPGPEQPAHDRALVDAAARAGVPRLVKLSAIGTGLADYPTLGQWHEPGEEAVRESGAEWTILRPTTFATNMLFWAPAIRSGEPVPNPFGDGRQGVVDPEDIAAVAVAALTDAIHSGQTYTLTGPDLWSLPEQVEIIGKALGRPAGTVELTAEQWREQMLASGADPAYADNVTTGVRFVRDGGNAVVTDDVARITGRPATSFEEWVDRHRAAFA
jgi:uncharacterized protein YbjT (DUF2867 family)